MKNEKTNWAFVTILLSMITILIMLCYTIKFIDTQARRIDTLEVENIRHNDRWGILSPSIKKEEKQNDLIYRL